MQNAIDVPVIEQKALGMAFLQLPAQKGRHHHRKSNGQTGEKTAPACRVLSVPSDPNGSRYKPHPDEHQNLKGEPNKDGVNA
ncbi:hypothetical protein MAR_029262 [Mya arenaria]|uniref:Uncharacterized protein n=1 Tax=Mya arenaria TaxID=6604 RepID=A0ABY7DIP5_MYAAR|nr:hypothetical protein MAR_029262 [Mya arenaria]